MPDAREALRSSGFRRALCSAILAGALLAAGCGVFGDDEKPEVRLSDRQYESLCLNNAIEKFIIERGYECPVQSVFHSTLEMEEALTQGAIDLKLEGWQQNSAE